MLVMLLLLPHEALWPLPVLLLLLPLVVLLGADCQRAGPLGGWRSSAGVCAKKHTVRLQARPSRHICVRNLQEGTGHAQTEVRDVVQGEQAIKHALSHPLHLVRSP
jgi:hypothetical protein